MMEKVQIFTQERSVFKFIKIIVGAITLICVIQFLIVPTVNTFIADRVEIIFLLELITILPWIFVGCLFLNRGFKKKDQIGALIVKETNIKDTNSKNFLSSELGIIIKVVFSIICCLPTLLNYSTPTFSKYGFLVIAPIIFVGYIVRFQLPFTIALFLSKNKLLLALIDCFVIIGGITLLFLSGFLYSGYIN